MKDWTPGLYTVTNSAPDAEFPDTHHFFRLHEDGTGEWRTAKGTLVYAAGRGEAIGLLEDWATWHRGRLTVARTAD